MHLPLFPVLLLLPTVLAWGRKHNPDPTEKPLFNSIYTSLDGLPACFVRPPFVPQPNLRLYPLTLQAKCFISEDYSSAHVWDVDWHDWCRARFERVRPPGWKTQETLYQWYMKWQTNWERCLKANCREDWTRELPVLGGGRGERDC
jgi:hypothetical protein